ncbi:MAG: glycosyltransferase family 39 protein [Planctomycetota bacterium]
MHEIRTPAAGPADSAAEGSTWEARLERKWPFVLLALLALACFFRLPHATGKYPSLDEQWHLNLSTGRGSFVSLFPEQELAVPPAVTSIVGAPSPAAVWSHMQGVMHPPLYVTVLRLWREAFGDGDRVAMGLSMLCSLLALAGCFLAARISFGVLTATLAGLLMAVSPTQAWFSVEIRGYAMLLALGAALLLLLVKVDRHGWTHRRGVGIALLLLALMLTHYFTVGVCAVAAIGVLLQQRGRARGLAAAAFAVAAVTYLAVWGPFFREQAADIGPMADSWLVDPRQPATLSLMLFVAYPARALLDIVTNPTAFYASLVPCGILYFAALLASVRRPRWRWWCAWLLATPLLLLGLDITRHSVHLQLLRYGAASTLAVYVLLPALLAAVSRWAAIAVTLPVAIGIAALGTEPDLTASPRYGAIMDTITASPQDRDSPPIVFVNGGGPPWHACGMMMEATHNPKTRGRALAWVQDVAGPDLMRELNGRAFWAVGVRAQRPPESFFPGARPWQGYLIGQCYALAMHGPGAR